MSGARRHSALKTTARRQSGQAASLVPGVSVVEPTEDRQSFAIRWFNWINFPVLFTKLWGALAIFWANDLYRMGFGGMAARDWLPTPAYAAYSMTSQAARMLDWGALLMWAFVTNGLLYLLYILISGEWRSLLPNRHTLREAAQVFLYTFRFATEPPPPRKFNGLQQISYTAIILICVGLLATHLAMYYPYQLPWVNHMLGGYDRARTQDFWLTAGYALFFSIHVVQLIKSGRKNLRAVIIRPQPDAGRREQLSRHSNT